MKDLSVRLTTYVQYVLKSELNKVRAWQNYQILHEKLSALFQD